MGAARPVEKDLCRDVSMVRFGGSVAEAINASGHFLWGDIRESFPPKFKVTLQDAAVVGNGSRALSH